MVAEIMPLPCYIAIYKPFLHINVLGSSQKIKAFANNREKKCVNWVMWALFGVEESELISSSEKLSCGNIRAIYPIYIFSILYTAHVQTHTHTHSAMSI